MYGLNDVLTEVTVRHNGDTTEYLAVMGGSAFVISFIQALILEWQDILDFFGSATISSGQASMDKTFANMEQEHAHQCSPLTRWGLLALFVSVSAMCYKGGSSFLMFSEAAYFNLSLLTGDLWSVLFSVTAERSVPQPLFFVALIFVLGGVVLYEMAPSPVVEDGDINKYTPFQEGFEQSEGYTFDATTGKEDEKPETYIQQQHEESAFEIT